MFVLDLHHCNTCGKDKPIQEMRVQRPQCLACRNGRSNAYYAANRERILVKHKKRYRLGTESRRTKISLIRAAKDVPCTDCGCRFPFYVMDLDHEGEKVFAFAHAETRSIAALRAELTKCTARCACCHRDKTYQAQIRSHPNNRKVRRQEALNKLKMKPCAKCGGTFKPWQMDFDHLENKEGVIGKIVKFRAWAFVMAEVGKCMLLCANCHREKTHIDRHRPWEEHLGSVHNDAHGGEEPMNWNTVEEAARLALAPLGLTVRSNMSRHVSLFVYATLEMGPENESIIIGIQCNVSGSETQVDSYRVRVDACREDSGEMVIDDIPSMTVDGALLLAAVRGQGALLVERARALLP